MSIGSGWPLKKNLLVYSKLNLSYKYSSNALDVGGDVLVLGPATWSLLPCSVAGCQATAANLPTTSQAQRGSRVRILDIPNDNYTTHISPRRLAERQWRQWYGVCFCFVCSCFYILATSKVISKWELTCNSAHSWRLYSAAPLGNQAASTVTQFPTQSHYPNTEPTSPCLLLIMLSTQLRSNKYQFDNSLP